MPHPSPLYRGLMRAGVQLVPALLRDPRQLAGHRGRLAAPERLHAWAAAHRDRARPLVWVHASSVGEGLQARAVIDALRTIRPDLQLIYTHYSPSAEDFARSVAANWAGYLAYDRVADVARMLDAATPDLLVFTKLDLWPELATAAAARGTKVAMIAATVSPASGRLRWPARQLGRAGYEALALAAAISADDATRLATLGADPARIMVAGDPRIDSVLQVAAGTATRQSLVSGLSPARTLVAGSTWPADEQVVLEAFAAVRRTHADAALVLAPHQPTQDHLTDIDNAASRYGLPFPVRLTRMEAGTMASLVLVDRVGVLAELYQSGMGAYVGGGWGTRGIHSVLEPAAAARPVVIGPHDRGSRDAALLAAGGGLIALPEAGGAAALAEIWSRWLADGATAARAGNAARAALEPERGAAMRNAAALVTVLG